MKTATHYILWGKPRWLTDPIKIMGGTLSECQMNLYERARQGWQRLTIQAETSVEYLDGERWDTANEP